MQRFSLHTAGKTGLLVLTFVLAYSGSLFAQGPTFASLETAAIELAPAPPAPVSFVTVPETSTPHGFWDGKNCALFAGVAALSAADFYVTHENLASGGTELNPVTRVFGRSSTGLAVNFSAETAGVIGLSYLFHKTGHHKMERLTTLANMSASGSAVAYDFAHR